MNNSTIKIVFTDLDGTLLNTKQQTGIHDLKMLHKLQQKGIIRVIATGRNLMSVSSVLPVNFPVDYVIFSSGAGIVDWKTQELIRSRNLSTDQIQHVSEILLKNKINFMLHKEVPDNHEFLYYRHNNVPKDFHRRLKRYLKYANKLNKNEINADVASQFLAIFKKLDEFNAIKKLLENVKVIRTTSPLDHQSIWMEIFPEDVSKQMGCRWLCEYLAVDPMKSIAFGNDYNDQDMLEWANQSFVVENSAKELKNLYPVTKSNNENGVHHILHQFL